MKVSVSIIPFRTVPLVLHLKYHSYTQGLLDFLLHYF